MTTTYNKTNNKLTTITTQPADATVSCHFRVNCWRNIRNPQLLGAKEHFG